MKQYKTAVYIGRFQPCHYGHLDVIKKALLLADKLIILIGSANLPRTPKNPWKYQERKQMLLDMLETENLATNVVIEPLNDYDYNHQHWLREVQEKVTGNSVCLIGHYKDDSSYYLNHFPNWDLVNLPLFKDIHSTNIREAFFQYNSVGLSTMVHPTTLEFLDSFQGSILYNSLLEEIAYETAYNGMWAHTPYRVIFQTVDAVVIQSGHILLVKRGQAPGKGLWALPGGFLDADETLVDGCIRELKEETKLKVPEKVLRGSIKNSKTYDKVDRSSRGRTITRAYLFELDDSQVLPKVRGADDAEKAQWFSLAEFYSMSTSMFEDHYSIIGNLIDN